jgi:methylmalonyl-CoA carboxyltransferase large subunit
MMAKTTMKQLAELLEQVQAQVTALSERVQQLESGPAPKPAAEAVSAAPPEVVKETPPPEPEKPEITEEELLAVSAALAAYLGVRVHIRQIRLLSSRAWSQQGRVSIQASHNVHI